MGGISELLRPGDHACLVYDTAAEQLDYAAAYIRDGLAAGERCVYLVGDRKLADIIGALDAGGVDVVREVTSGALRFDAATRTYLAGGTFDPASTINLIIDRRAEAIAGGYSGLRAAGEMGWAADGDPALLEYERAVNTEIFGLGRVTGLCQYERGQFSGSRLAQLLAAHPVVLDPART